MLTFNDSSPLQPFPQRSWGCVNPLSLRMTILLFPLTFSHRKCIRNSLENMKIGELTNSDSILKSSVIKQIGWELAQGRVHTILDLETNRTDPKNHQTFKQRLRQTSTTQDEKRKKNPVRLSTTLLIASVTNRTGCCTDLFLSYNKNHQNCRKCFRVVFLPEKLWWYLYISILVL